MRGQWVITIQVVYAGWMQNIPATWKDKQTRDQQNPLSQDTHNTTSSIGKNQWMVMIDDYSTSICISSRDSALSSAAILYEGRP